ncbi:Uncharacterised protein [Mycobacteroides abscessus subsp. abscessus]|nr:Uncharacterised protein [Mycobacteroides abscessus subsp. abscessus]
MSADDNELVVHGAMSDGHTGRRRNGDCAGHAGYDRHLHTGLGARQHFFVAASEDERVSALQAHDELAFLGAFDKHSVDLLLRHRAPVRDLRRVDDLDMRSQIGE